jgi:hypothetical protein
MTDRSEIIDFYALKKSKELMSLGDIRKELSQKIDSEEDIKAIINEIDLAAVSLVKNQGNLQLNRIKMLAGYVLMAIAAILSVLIFTKLLIAQNDYLLFLLFIPLLLGYGMIYTARKKIKQKQ